MWVITSTRGPGFLEVVRIFSRYQALIVFALAVLVAQAFWIIHTLLAGRSGHTLALALLAIAVAAPVVVQSCLLAWNILAVPNERVLALYGLEESRPQIPIQVAGRSRFYLRSAGHQTALLQQGYWIAECRTDLSLPGEGPRLRADKLGPLSFEAPDRLDELGTGHIIASAPAGVRALVPNLRRLPGFDVESPGGSGRRRQLTVTATYRGNREGLVASSLGLPVTAAFVLLLARRGRRSPGPR